MLVYAIHENPEWFGPFADAFKAEGVPYEEWLLGEGVFDFDAPPPDGIFWSRMSASAHTRGHDLAKDHTRAVLAWLEAYGRRVVNGRRVLEWEMSKVDQLTALRVAGFDAPRTIAVVGKDELAIAAEKIPAPFITKHNQGGKGLGVQRFDSHAEFAEQLEFGMLDSPADGITLLQEYITPAAPFITRVEIVGGEFLYAITADTARGGFQLCPADACAIGPDGEIDESSIFALRTDVDPQLIRRYLDFARKHGIEIAGIEFIESADGRVVTYDVNTNTNYNADVEAVAPKSGPREIARFLRSMAENGVPGDIQPEHVRAL